jgi:hypothetical protein
MEANQQAPQSSIEETFGEVIYSYSRMQAIQDGVLVDLSSFFPNDTRLYKWPVACTAAVWRLIENACHKTKTSEYVEVPLSEAGPWVWDLCWMSVKAKTRVISSREHLFVCTIGRKPHTFKAVCGPGDDGEPVVTLMLPDED